MPKPRKRRWTRILAWTSAAIVSLLIGAIGVAYFTSGNTCNSPRPTGAVSRAVIYCSYGPPEVLELEEISKPVPDDNRILVKVHASSVNPVDWHFMEGTPYLVRVIAGLRAPNDILMGTDFAGTVEAVGKAVTQFKPGDEVFGARDGAFGDYVSVAEDRGIAAKPSNVSFEEAAAVPVAAVTALQGLRDVGKIHMGQRVLINGASGGVGTFAVQIAKQLGAEVTGVSSTRNGDLVRSLGADHVIDYTREDYTATAERYDLILDCVGNRPLLANRKILTPDGVYVGIGGGGPADQGLIGPMIGPIKMMVLGPFVKQQLRTFEAKVNPADLATLAGWMAAGRLKPVIDRRYPLAHIADAMRYLEAGHARGKVIVDIN
jgi:NADPH:quinone reductase-like Zn-dependent oxidoreductase